MHKKKQNFGQIWHRVIEILEHLPSKHIIQTYVKISRKCYTHKTQPSEPLKEEEMRKKQRQNKVICETTGTQKIKVLTALVDRLSLSVGWENGPERGLKTVLLNS